MGKWIAANWVQVLFALFGIFTLCLSGNLLLQDRATAAIVPFGLAFLSFFFVNLSRFKRIKGFGFEAETWEDKQKEAADLIERLRAVVTIYSREILLEKVKGGRFGIGEEWKARWALYDELATRHKELGQNVDFTQIKREMDVYFLFDICMRIVPKNSEVITTGRSRAHQKFTDATAPKDRNTPEFNRKIDEINSIPHSPDKLFELSRRGTLASDLITVFDAAKTKLAEFGVEVSMPQQNLHRLTTLRHLYNNQPVKVTDELIEWSTK